MVRGRIFVLADLSPDELVQIKTCESCNTLTESEVDARFMQDKKGRTEHAVIFNCPKCGEKWRYVKPFPED
jgi:RNase P subunit RPR2